MKVEETRPCIAGGVSFCESVVAGTTMKGRVVVDNESGKVIPARGCISLFQVILTNASYQPLVPWEQCGQELDIPTGVSTYPIAVLGSVNAGTAQLGPLAPGSYTAQLYQSTHVVPVPPRFAVEVVAP